MLRQQPDGKIVRGDVIDTAPLHALLEIATRELIEPHEREYILTELERQVSQLRETAGWFEERIKGARKVEQTRQLSFTTTKEAMEFAQRNQLPAVVPVEVPIVNSEKGDANENT